MQRKAKGVKRSVLNDDDLEDNEENADPNASVSAESMQKIADKSLENKPSLATEADDAPFVEKPCPYHSENDLLEAAGRGDSALLNQILQPKLTLTVSPDAKPDGDKTSETAKPKVAANKGDSTTYFSDLLGRALVRACAEGRGDVSHSLLQMGADVTAVDPTDRQKQPPLHKAAANGSLNLLKILLAKHPEGIDETDKVRSSSTQSWVFFCR